MMMTKSVDFESVLSLIDKTIVPIYLSSTQEIVLRETWQGKTYSEIAYEHNYDSEYIKTVGCNLWQTLSNAFNEQINKSNFVPLMRQKTIECIETEKSEKSLPSIDQTQSTSTNFKNEQLCHWATAPHTKYFIGREKELKTLGLWTQESDCRCIIVSGMVGCGKTTLVTKFAREIKNQFDGVIWFSLQQTPPLATLLDNYLNIINKNFGNPIKPKSLELNFLLSEFIECLKQHKILLVIDGLQYILNNNRVNVTYKQTFKEYGQLLRAIVTTSHRSLLIATSCIKPTILEYYSTNQVKFLDLQGFDLQTTKIFLNFKNSIFLDEQIILPLSANLQSNPQLLKIASNHLDNFSTEDTEQILQDLSLLEAIMSLLEQELQYLSDLNQEIIYWLAISCSPLSLTELNQSFEIAQPRVKLLQGIDYLLKRSLIIKHGETYSLMPVMKNYLRRKLVKTVLQNNNL
jgi:hypothetical protein